MANIPTEEGYEIAIKKIEDEKIMDSSWLDLSELNLTKLPPEIAELTNLTWLCANSNQLNSLPVEIEQLKNLTRLDIKSNQFTTLPAEINQLKNLTSLHIGHNQLTDLPAEIGQLKKLTLLNIGHNKITTLPISLQQLKHLRELHLEGNPLAIPPEILQKRLEPQTILDYYFSRTKKALNESKVLVVGQGNVGKTSLIRKIIKNEFYNGETKTEGIAIIRTEVVGSESNIQLNIWDFGGQEIMHATHQFFLTKRSLYLLVLDSRLTQEENRVEYWLKIIESYSGQSPILIIGNKIDQHPLDIDRTGLRKKYPNIAGILETSAATGNGIEELKAAITKQVNNLPHVRDLLPETWFTIKTKLEALGREKNYISQENYLELCAENKVSDETSQRTLIGFLHDLGVVLHFQDDPRLETLGILNPQWVTNGVYKILNSHALYQNKGVLTTPMLNEILTIDGYPRDKRLFIVDMMKKFELCYNIETDRIFLVPDLLPKDEPQLEFNGIPAFEYVYPVLPSSIVTRFIVRMNLCIDDGIVWRSGILLKIGKNHALVKADLEDRKISITISGAEYTRRDTLAAIRYQLDEIHASIKGLNPEKFVPIPGAVNARPLKYEYLLKLERDGEDTLKVEDGDFLRKVNIIQMLNGVESEYERKQYSNVTHIHIGGNVDGSNIIAGDTNIVDHHQQKKDK